MLRDSAQHIIPLKTYVGMLNCFDVYTSTSSHATDSVHDATNIYATIYGKNLLFSSSLSCMKEYINDIALGQTFLTTDQYKKYMKSLSEPYNSMIVADMEYLNTKKTGFTFFIPTVFLKYPELFKHIIFSVKFSAMNDALFSNMVFQNKDE